MTRLEEFLAYHDAMDAAGDIDPTYPMLRYVSDRFELNEEQRFWLSYLYAMTYCGATVFYIYNEFPDAENVDEGRLRRWWAANREKLVFQTDRRWVRSRNQFCGAVMDYRRWLRGQTQAERFAGFASGARNDAETYRRAYASAATLYQMGRFGLFLFLEAVHVVTGFRMEPNNLDMANAESSRNGLCYALGQDGSITGPETGRTRLTSAELAWLGSEFDFLLARMKGRPWQRRAPDVWSVETTLCAFKKHKRSGSRYVGYYLDRQAKEIQQMQANVTEGVAWRVLWEFRQETFLPHYLRETSSSEELQASARATSRRAS